MQHQACERCGHTENNQESIFEVQFLEVNMGSSDDASGGPSALT
jgi:hypothetical protein